ncbi:cor protein [Citrobacter freundii]|uniref:Cor protein n=1 Tax=Citrobacter freundii TaxID=546 RepID=A0ABD7AWQ8_CITFR|nr:cor protein [Citrobacter freundii]QLY36026.1 cor protein [Citrobacter freundii]QMA46969.1 cor protein [Citrobacter freundii]
MKTLLIIPAVLALSACSGILERQSPVCTATAIVGGQEMSVSIYGVRKVANQTQYQAGYPFNWKWVSKTNFIRTTCQ